MASSEFDLDAFVRAVENRDAGGQLGAYADDAQVMITDATAPPSSLRTLDGTAAIGQWIGDVASRDMVHQVTWAARDGDRIALVENCEYPGGEKVLCLTTLDVVDGRIARQLVSQTWDG
ncbi:MAG TPA: nuclear transport factor 2 family protein [Nocardioides sp.]|nr:nuclear transport factor 2 family protein [Nocardioides sp.]